VTGPFAFFEGTRIRNGMIPLLFVRHCDWFGDSVYAEIRANQEAGASGLAPSLCPISIVLRYIFISECDIISMVLEGGLSGGFARPPPGGSKGERSEFARSTSAPAQVHRRHMQGMRQAFREDHLRPVRDEDPSGRPGQKNTRRKRQRLGKMGITGLRAQTPPLIWRSKIDLIPAGGSTGAEVFEFCLPGPVPLQGRHCKSGAL